MRVISYFFFIYLFQNVAFSQVLYNNDSSFTIQNSGLLYVEGDIEIDSNGYFNNSGSVWVEGDWDNNTSVSNGHTPNTGNVILYGPTQIIKGNTVTTFNNLTIQGAGDKTLDIACIVGGNSGQLNLNGRSLILNSKLLTITNSSNSAIVYNTGGTPASYIMSESIDGGTNNPNLSMLRWDINADTGEYVIPFGSTVSPNDLIPSKFHILSPGDSFGYAVFSTYPTGNDNLPFADNEFMSNVDWNGADNSSNVVDRFWRFDLDNYLQKKPTAKVSVSFFSTERNGVPVGAEALQRWNGAIQKWDFPFFATVSSPTINAPSLNTEIAKTIISTDSFRNWWAISNTAQPLPIELLRFEGHKENEDVKLLWSTATELNNDYFTIERADPNMNFTHIIDIVNAAGTSFNTLNYTTYDKEPLLGYNYYRLKQTDFDGTYNYSNIISVYFEGNNNSVVISPNPVKDVLSLIFNSHSILNTKCLIYNNIGELVNEIEFRSNPGLNNKLIPLDYLSEGIYFLTFQQGERQNSFKFLVGS